MKTDFDLEKILETKRFFPVMGEPLDVDNTMLLDFSAANEDLSKLNLQDTEAFDRYVFDQLLSSQKKYGIGGYLEHRAIYGRSAVFAIDADDHRNIHLGVDIWALAGTPVYAPLDGKVHSFGNNEGFGNYGPTVILEHFVNGMVFHTLYGHLALEDLVGVEQGQVIKKGEMFCHLGAFPVNGDWPPHLHLQIIRDMMGGFGDFPGVCALRDIDKYRINCPNPLPLTGCLLP